MIKRLLSIVLLIVIVFLPSMRKTSNAQGSDTNRLRPNAMTWSPDGNLLAIGRTGGVISILNSDFETIQEFDLGRDAGVFNKIIWSPNSSHLAARLASTGFQTMWTLIFIDLTTNALETDLQGTSDMGFGSAIWNSS